MSMPLLRRPRGPGQQSASEIDSLRAENQRLRQMVANNASGAADESGYLFKYRPQATSSLWANTWENRYFLLQGHTLAYFRSERDVHLPPRGKIDLPGTYIAIEGVKRGKYHTFNIQDKAGDVLIRLSTERAPELQTWVDALEGGGATLKDDDDSSRRGRSPSPTQSGSSAVSDGRAASPDRGEVDSVKGAQPGGLSRSKSGYTSDASDVGDRIAGRYGSGKSKSSKKERGCALVHVKENTSPLSRERIQYQDQKGIITLMFLIIVATNARLILENSVKYGLLFNPFSFLRAAFTPSGAANFLLLLCWPVMFFNCLLALWIERLAAALLRLDEETPAKGAGQPRHRMSGAPPVCSPARVQFATSLAFVLHTVNAMTEILLPCAVIYYTDAEPLPAFALTMVCIILWMKLVSFAHVNSDIRRARLTRSGRSRFRPGERSSHERPTKCEKLYDYPENLSLGNVAYFVAAPTLCYQLSYPRSPRFRLRWLIYKFSGFCIGLGTMLFIMEQYIEPTIDNSLQPLRKLDWLRMMERILKLSIPTTYFWIAMFYTLFDLWLNVLGELTRFGDRDFYKEWWNATTVGEYWRLWNMPVHKWMLRHVYYPCIGAGVNKFASGFIVFFISAVFHEVLVGVPLHMLRGWAFWGILGQVPLMWVTEWMKRKSKNDYVGNVVFWVSFCFLGQPLAEILYFHDYRKMRQL